MKSEYDLKQVELQWNKAMQFFSGSEGRERMLNAGAVVAVGAVSVYASRALFPLLGKGLNNYFFQPKVGFWRPYRAADQPVPEVQHDRPLAPHHAQAKAAA